MALKADRFETVYSTSTTLCVQLTPRIRLCARRHSNRFTGSSMWASWIEKRANWGFRENPFDRSDITYRECYTRVKANAFRGVILARNWDKKADIADALALVPEERPITNP